MKNSIFLVLFICLCFTSLAQSVKDYAVELSVKTSNNPTTITLQWQSDASAIKYYIYKKSKTEWTWKFLDSSLTKTDSFYIDNSVTSGMAYEYWVSKKKSNLTANGYIYAGMDIPAIENRGIAILLVDSNYVLPLQNEIAQYENDLKNDGWEIKKHHVLRTENVADVKAIIYKEWLADSLRVKNVILLGNIPVPYSGNIAPDGHPDHEGAWPADVYYSTFDLAWTDNQINNSVASRTENKNTKGDGKFDASYIWPALSKISVGRIDLTKMPVFGLNDTLLMKRYLDKNHQYRIGNLKAEKRGLIDDNFGVFGGEAFASSAYRNYSTLFSSAISTTDYHSTLKNSSYLLSFGCGGGSYTSCGGIGSTTDFANDSLLNPFTMLFGSYFLDWDAENNYLRAPLASKGWGLASISGGRPYPMLHHTALGESIGFAAVCGQNAYPTYKTGLYDFGTYVHIALMGDPTLRLFNAPIIENLKAETNCNNSDVLLSWKKNTNADSVRVYIWNNQTSGYDYQISIPSVDSFYYDANSGAGKHAYMLRTIKNEMTPSGNFFDIGMMEKIEVISYEPLLSKINFDTNIHYCKNDSFVFSDITSHPLFESRTWNFNNQNYIDSLIKIPFSENGNYTVYLKNTTTQNCESNDSFILNIQHFLDADFTVSDTDICQNETFKITPNNINNADSILIFTTPFLESEQGTIYEFNAKISGKISITQIYQDANNCKDSMTQNIFINVLPFDSTSFINYKWKTDSCFNSHELELEYQNASSDDNYFWSFGDGDSAFNVSYKKKKYQNPGNYLVTLKAQNKNTNCESSIEKNIYVYENPILSNIHSIWLTDSCLNTHELELSYLMDTNFNTFIWYFGDGDSTINIQNISKKYTSAGNYVVKLKAITDSTGCTAEIQKNITVYEHPLLPKLYASNTSIIENKPEIIWSDDEPNYKYFWHSDGNLSASDSLHKINFLANKIGNYFVSLKTENEFGCQSDSAFISLNVLVNGMLKIDNSLFSVYPNPTKNHVNIENNNLLKGNFELTDINGKTFQKGNISSQNQQQFLFENLATGIYFLNIYSEEFYSVYKIIIEN